MVFVERLREAMTEKSISQEKLGEMVGLSRQGINSYCNGHREPSFEILIKICKALDVSSDYLLGLKEY